MSHLKAVRRKLSSPVKSIAPPAQMSNQRPASLVAAKAKFSTVKTSKKCSALPAQDSATNSTANNAKAPEQSAKTSNNKFTFKKVPMTKASYASKTMAIKDISITTGISM
jgi:hypothetical protein